MHIHNTYPRLTHTQILNCTCVQHIYATHVHKHIMHKTYSGIPVYKRHTQSHTQMYILHKYTSTNVYTHLQIYLYNTHTNTCMCTNTYTHIPHTYTNSYMNTHTHIQGQHTYTNIYTFAPVSSTLCCHPTHGEVR
uniref:Uncharacterized protein n=1 Tax=Sus scrofa TaxID=9823 RepID=A0A8D1M7H6_PIG